MLPDLIQKIISKKGGLTAADAKVLEEYQATLQNPETPDTEEAPAQQVEVQTTPQEPKDEANPDTQDANTEENWKKRYGDLRKFSDDKAKADKQRLEEALKRAEEAEKALNSSKTKYVAPESLAKFDEEYGEIAPIVRELALQEAQKLFDERIKQKEAEETAKKAAEESTKSYKSQAASLIAEKHPDFDEVGRSSLFKVWLDAQSDVVQTLARSEDPQSIVFVLDLYKKDSGFAQKKVVEQKKKVAEAVTVDKEPKNPETPQVLDLVKLKKQIDAAMKNGGQRAGLEKLLNQYDKAVKQLNKG
jgi:hypothetical protein